MEHFPKESFVVWDWPLFCAFIVCSLFIFTNYQRICYLLYSPVCYDAQGRLSGWCFWQAMERLSQKGSHWSDSFTGGNVDLCFQQFYRYYVVWQHHFHSGSCLFHLGVVLYCGYRSMSQIVRMVSGLCASLCMVVLGGFTVIFSKELGQYGTVSLMFMGVLLAYLYFNSKPSSYADGRRRFQSTGILSLPWSLWNRVIRLHT